MDEAKKESIAQKSDQKPNLAANTGASVGGGVWGGSSSSAVSGSSGGSVSTESSGSTANSSGTSGNAGDSQASGSQTADSSQTSGNSQTSGDPQTAENSSGSVGGSGANDSGASSGSSDSAGGSGVNDSTGSSNSTTPDPNTSATDSNVGGESSGSSNATDPSTSQPGPVVQPQDTQTRSTIQKLADSLGSAQNTGVSTYQWENEDRAVLWVKGIKYPDLSTFTKVTSAGYSEYNLDYQTDKKWYDVDKKSEQSTFLCSAAVSANMLHWWLEQNDAYVQKFLTKNTGKLPSSPTLFGDLKAFLNSYHSQETSEIFDMWTHHYGDTNGVWADTVRDLFINGYTPKIGAVNTPANADSFTPDTRGGFFYEVFGTQILTQRVPEGSNGSPNKASYDLVNTTIKQWLQDGKILGISFMTKSYQGHIYTIWGAEFDLNGDIKAIFISDSDDAGSRARMKRVHLTKDTYGFVKISNNLSIEDGPRVLDTYSLSLGTDLWEEYFRTSPKYTAPGN